MSPGRLCGISLRVVTPTDTGRYPFFHSIARAEEAHPALKSSTRRVHKTPLRKKIQEVATRRRASTATDTMGHTAMTATEAISNTGMIAATEATSDTAMLQGRLPAR